MATRRPALTFGLLLGLSMPSVTAGSQPGADSPVEPPPFVTRVDGDVTLVRGAKAEVLAHHWPLLEGDRVDSGAGRAAIQWTDGSLIALDHGTTIDFSTAGTLRLARGRMIIVAAAAAPFMRVVTSNAAATVDPVSRCLVWVSGLPADWADSTGIEVDYGLARLVSDGGALQVTGGQIAFARGAARPAFGDFLDGSGPDVGEFRQWAEEATGGAGPVPTGGSSAYLPGELYPFGPTLARYGSWELDLSGSWVWYPQARAGWRPYSVGAWRHLGHYGWFWVGNDPWVWPTHYYGRWGLGTRGRWHWRPDRRWAPAWVSWAIGPGYVSWCPLGWSGAPVVPAPFSTARGPGGGDAGWRGESRHDSWRGWTTVRASAFGTAQPAERVAVEASRLTRTERGAFVMQSAPPRARGLTPSLSMRTHLSRPSSSWPSTPGPSMDAIRGGSLFRTRMPTYVSVPRPSTPAPLPGWTDPPAGSAVGLGRFGARDDDKVPSRRTDPPGISRRPWGGPVGTAPRTGAPDERPAGSPLPKAPGREGAFVERRGGPSDGGTTAPARAGRAPAGSLARPRR